MKNTAKLQSHLLLTLFLIMSITVCNGQEFFNYNNDATNTSNAILNREKVTAILNSDSIRFSALSNISRTSSSIQADENKTTLEINYLNLSQINSVQNQQIRNCIVKVTAPTSTLNLNALNQFTNLEIIHIIIENPSISGNIQDLIIMNNSNVLISYQISIPQ